MQGERLFRSTEVARSFSPAPPEVGEMPQVESPDDWRAFNTRMRVNKPGAAGTLGTDAAAKATRDGYTLLLAPACR